jgi:hypothetical protein
VPLAAVGVQDTLPHRQNAFGERARALQPDRRQRRVRRGLAPLATVSVQNTPPRRRYALGQRGAATCVEGQLFKPPKRALQPERRRRRVWRGDRYPTPQWAFRKRYCAVNRYLASAMSLRAAWASPYFQAAKGSSVRVPTEASAERVCYLSPQWVCETRKKSDGHTSWF